MWEPVVPNAVPAIAWEGGQDEDAQPLNTHHHPSDMYNSKQGIKIGILDTITNNGDRHAGNWMVQHSADPYTPDIPVPIDHGNADMDDVQVAKYGGAGPFGENLFGHGRESEQLAAIPDAAWMKWIHGVSALAPQFKAYGMTRQLDTVQNALSAAAMMSAAAKEEAPRATGKPFTPDAAAFWTAP
jgi:hypothetical protein